MSISHKHIRQKIIAYLGLQQRDPVFIKQFKTGYCNGFVVLGLYGCYLESLQRPGNLYPPQDDWAWFKKTLRLLDKWDEDLASLSDENKNDIERFISLIESIQHNYNYVPRPQSNLHQFISDTRQRKLSLEFSIAGLFTADDFNKPIILDNTSTSLIDELLKEDKRLILISTGGHTMGMFRNGNKVHFYNPNNKNGRKTYSLEQKTKLMERIFKARHYKLDKPSPLGFRVFTFDQAQPYLPTKKILDDLQSPVTPCETGYAKQLSALHIAACIGSVECMRYYLEKGADIDAKTNADDTAFELAGFRRQMKSVMFLAMQGAEIRPNKHLKHLHSLFPQLASSRKATSPKPRHHLRFYKPGKLMTDTATPDPRFRRKC